MATEFWKNDAKASSATARPSSDNFWEGDAPAAKQALPEDVKPSTAGGGRGAVNPTDADRAAEAAASQAYVGHRPLRREREQKPVDNRTVLERSVEESAPGRVSDAEIEHLTRDSTRPVERPQRSRLLASDLTLDPIRGDGPRNLAEAAADTGLGIYQGAAGMVKGVADNVNAGDNLISKGLGIAIKGADRLKSDELRGQVVARQGRVESAQKNQGELGAARVAFQTLFDMPAAAMDVGAQGAGSLVPTLLLGAAGAGPRLMAAVNAGSTAGDSAAQVADKLRKLAPTVWDADDKYRNLIGRGMSHEQAVGLLAPIYALPSQAAGALAGAISGRIGVEKTITGGNASNTIGSRIQSMLAEHAGEQVETVLPTLANNATVGAVDGKTGLADGLGAAMVDTAAGTMAPGTLAATRGMGGAAAPAGQPSAEQMARDRGFLRAGAPAGAPSNLAAGMGAPAPAAAPVAPAVAPAQPVAALVPLPPPPRPAGALERAAQAVHGPDPVANPMADPKARPKTAAERAEAQAEVDRIEAEDRATAEFEALMAGDEVLLDEAAAQQDILDTAAAPPATAKTEAKDAPAPSPAPAPAAAPEAPDATHASVEAAADFIQAQKRSGTSITAVPYTAPDGTITVATQGSPNYAAGVEQREQRRQAEQRAAAGIKDGDITLKTGEPFKSRRGAMNKAGDGQEVVEVKGGFVVRAKGATDERTTGAAGAEAGPGAGAGSADASAGVEPVLGRKPAAGPAIPAAPAADVEPAASERAGSATGGAPVLKAAAPAAFKDGIVVLHGTVVAFTKDGKTITGIVNNKFTEADRAAGKKLNVRIGAFKGKGGKTRTEDIGEAEISAIVKQSPWAPDYAPAVNAKAPDVKAEAAPVNDTDAAANEAATSEANDTPSLDGSATIGGGAKPVGDIGVGGADAAADGSDAKAVGAQGDSGRKPVGRAARSGEPDAAKPKGRHHGRVVDSKLAGDGGTTDALLRKGYGSLDTPDQARVLKSVLALAHDLKVTDGIVEAIPVPVMNQLLAGKFPTERGFHDRAVLVHALSVHPDLSVRADAIDALVRSPMFPVAELRATSDQRRGLQDDGAAVGASESDGHSAFSPLSDKPLPTPDMIEAGNYQKQHVRHQGISLSIENPKGSVRQGMDAQGNPWSNVMQAAYGYAKGSEAADGDHVDVFVGPAADRAPTVWVVDQVNADGSYDEAKALFGFMNKRAAVAAYKASYSKGWKVGPVHEMTVDEFKAGLESGRFKKALDPTLSIVTPGVKTEKPKAKKAPDASIPEGGSTTSDAAQQRADAAAAEKKRRAAGDRARARAWQENPGRAFLAKHGISTDLASEWAPGAAERRQAMVQGFGPIFRKSGMQLDTLAQAAVEEGFLLEPDEMAMHAMIDKAIRKQRVVPQYAEGVAEDEMEARIAQQRQFEQDAHEALQNADLSDDFIDQLDAMEGSEFADVNELLRAAGATDEDVQAAQAIAAAEAAQRRDSDDPGAGESEPSTGQALDPAGQGLTSPTAGEVVAQQERAAQGERAESATRREREARLDADAQRSEFTLTGSDRAADANPNQGMMFSVADDKRVAKAAEKAAAKAAAAQQKRDEAFRRWSDDAPLVTSAAANAYPFKTGEKIVVEAFHGSKRPDRIGGVFDPKRATSGPMAYFTSSPDLASNYATQKSDTSLSDEDQQYANWFKVKVPGQRSEVPIDRAWYSLTPEQKATVAKRMPDIRQDDDGNVIYEEGGGDPGSYGWELQQTQRGYDRAGNPLKAATETWLNSGNLFDDELKFMDVLRLAGFPMGMVRSDFPTDEFPGVFKTFIAMKKPLVVNDMPAEVRAALDEAAKRDRSRPQAAGADSWDKRTRTVKDWHGQFTGTNGLDPQYAWTSIPDKVTDVFKSFGYDGIVDWSGKGGGHQHPVYIPFGPTQVKSAFNRGTFDPAKKDINLRTADQTASTPVKTKPASTDHVNKAERLLERMRAEQKNFISFQAVEPDDATDTGKHLAAVRTAAKRLFGHDVVFVRFNGTPLFNGVMSGAFPDTVFIRVDSPRAHMAILGHELLHSLRKQNPRLYKAMADRLETLANDKTADYHVNLAEQYKRLGFNMPEDWKEELWADVVGDNFMNPQFWQDMAAEQPDLMRRVANAIMRFLDGVISKLSGSRPFGTDRFLKDAEEARRVVTSAMRQFSEESVQKTGLAAAIPKAPPTESPAFKRWFKGSKVVDDAGKPMVMYHGTSASDGGDAFTYFNTYASNYGLMGQGGYFTADPAVASSYTAKGRGTTPTVYPVYLTIKNPVDMDAPADRATWEKGFPDVDFAEYVPEKPTNEGFYRAVEQHFSDQMVPAYEGAEIMQKGLRQAGFDGITHMGGGRVQNADTAVRHRVFVAFDPEQIKSATGNRGTYDPERHDMRMSVRPTGLAAFMQGSKVVNPDGSPLVVYHGTHRSFNSFDASAPSVHIPLPGFYFTPDPSIASAFAEGGAKTAQDRQGRPFAPIDANVMPVYLALKNPAEIDGSNAANGGRMPSEKVIQQKLETAQKNGHDGAIIRGWTDGSGPIQYVAFRPEQIKSATGNSGAYDPEQADIRLSVAGGDPQAKRDNRAFSRAVFEGSLNYTRDQNRKPVRLSDQRKKYEAIDTDERGQMLLRQGIVTADQLKRWKGMKLDVYDGAVNNRFRKHFEQPGLVWTDAELRDRFKMDDEGIRFYRELRAQADADIAKQAMADMLNKSDADGFAIRYRVLAEPLDVAAITLRDHLLALATAEPKRSRVLIDRANQIIDILDEANDLMNSGHVPDHLKASARPNKWESTVPGRLDRFIYEMQDGKIDLKRTQEAITKDGNTIREEFDARLAETLHSGRVMKRTLDFKEKEELPLLEEMAKHKIGQTEFGDYLHARAAPERNAQIAKINPLMPEDGSGDGVGAGRNSKDLLLTTEAAIQYIADIPAERREIMERLAERVDAITKGTREVLVAEGLEDAEAIAAWEKAYSKYVPMLREDVEFSRAPGSGGIAKTKRAMGSNRQAENILANVMLQREAAIARGEANRVKVALYGLALTNPNPDFWVTIRPDDERAQMMKDLESMGIDPAQAEEGMSRGPTIRVVDPKSNQVTEKVASFIADRPTAITLMVNGQHRILLLNESDPRALRLATAIKGADDLTKFDLAGSMVGKTTRFISAMLTQYNLAFGAHNFLRDLSGGTLNLGNTELHGKEHVVFGRVLNAMRGISAHQKGRKDKNKWSVLFEQFQQDGGQTGFREMFADGTAKAQDLESRLKKMQQAKVDPRRIGRAVLSWISETNDMLENGVRLAAYATALDQGMSRQYAARLARELTVDFNRKGRATREIGPLYAFFNAATQGTERTIRLLRGPTGKSIIAGGLTLGILQSLMLAAAGYDEDDVPEFVKARALIIPMFDDAKTYAAVPLPLGLHVLPNTGRVLTDMVIGDRQGLGKKAWDAFGEIVAAFNPLGGGSIVTPDGALRTIAPTVVDPIIELGFNKNFAGTPIEREARGESDTRPGYQRARESTQRRASGQAYLGISKAMNWATGGDEVEAGKISPSPERIRYIAQIAGGGVLREVEKITDLVVAGARGERIKATGIPIVGRLAGQVDPERAAQSRYYENLRRIETTRNALNAAKKAGNGEAYERIQQREVVAPYIKAGAKIDRQIRALNKAAVEVIGNPAEQKEIDATRVEAMKSLNDAIKEAELLRHGPTIADKMNLTR